MKYISIKETSEKWGISTRRIQILCKEDRIPGAFHVGNSWAIPDNAEKPKDARIKSGKYIKRSAAATVNPISERNSMYAVKYAWVFLYQKWMAH